MKKRRSTEEIIKRLRTPAPGVEKKPAPAPVQTPPEPAAPEIKPKKDILLVVLGGICAGLVLITLLFWLGAKNRAEDIIASLDPGQVQGLAVKNEEFNPTTGVTYVQIQEGQDRNVAVSNLGSTLPVISRFNLKTFTEQNYRTVGAAPWALTTNFESNLADPELMRYLLDNEKMIQAFLARPDVAPLLEDPQLLSAFAKDPAMLADFFQSDTVKGVLGNEKMVRLVAGSRFMSHLLISPAVKYFRQRPQEAVAIINASPQLRAVRANPAVQAAVRENPYLKNIAETLLKVTPARPAARAAANTGNAKTRAASRTSARTKK